MSEERAVALLSTVGLQELLGRFSLGDTAEWGELLSGGQKQRLSWCRLYFHNPRFALVDEATSAISSDMVHHLYDHAKRLGITLVSISHQPEIDQHHEMALDLDRSGGFSFGPLAEVEDNELM